MMFGKKPDNQRLTNRFKTDELILVSTPILLILIAIILILVAPRIVRSWEIDRCLEIKGIFDEVKDECVVIRK
jgi:hypothetical protein